MFNQHPAAETNEKVKKFLSISYVDGKPVAEDVVKIAVPGEMEPLIVRYSWDVHATMGTLTFSGGDPKISPF